MNNWKKIYIALSILLYLIPFDGFAQVFFTEPGDTSELKYFPRRIDNMSTLIELDSNNSEYYVKRSVLYYKLKDYHNAIKDDNSLLRILGENDGAYCNRGLAYCFLGDSAQAIADTRKAIELKPDRAVNHLNLGFIYLYFNEYEKALPCLYRALKLDEDYSKAYYYAGYAYIKLHKNSVAKINLLKSIQLSLASPDAEYNLAYIAYHDGEYEKAIAHLNDARMMNSRYDEIKQFFEIRGDCYAKTGDDVKAKIDLSRAASLEDKN